jgi:hypothetical protein
MVIMPPTKEDRIKSLFYSELAREIKTDDIGEYTRRCIYYEWHSKEGYKKRLRLEKSFTLSDLLMEIAEEAINAPPEKRIPKKFKKRDKRKTQDAYDSYDQKAFKMIRRCCRGFRDVALEYYRFYRRLKGGKDNPEIYIDYKEEESPIPLNIKEEDIPEYVKSKYLIEKID